MRTSAMNRNSPFAGARSKLFGGARETLPLTVEKSHRNGSQQQLLINEQSQDVLENDIDKKTQRLADGIATVKAVC